MKLFYLVQQYVLFGYGSRADSAKHFARQRFSLVQNHSLAGRRGIANAVR